MAQVADRRSRDDERKRPDRDEEQPDKPARRARRDVDERGDDEHRYLDKQAAAKRFAVECLILKQDANDKHDDVDHKKCTWTHA